MSVKERINILNSEPFDQFFGFTDGINGMLQTKHYHQYNYYNFDKWINDPNTYCPRIRLVEYYLKQDEQEVQKYQQVWSEYRN